MSVVDTSHHHSAGRRRDQPRPKLAELPVPGRASLDELRQEWRRLYHCEPPRLSRELLVGGIGYRLQELQHGGLSKSMRRNAPKAGSLPILGLASSLVPGWCANGMAAPTPSQ
jgi:hypothetical protein